MNCDSVIEVTEIEPRNTDVTMEVQTSRFVRIVLDPPIDARDWCHVCLSEGVRVSAGECDDSLHEQTGSIVMDVVA